MEHIDIKLPNKRGRPRNSIRTPILLELSQTSTRAHHLLNSLQTKYDSNFKLINLINGTWQYFLSKALPKNIFNWSMIELLKIAAKEFMLSELEYVAIISLLQREEILSLNIPSSILLNAICFEVKVQTESNTKLVSLLHDKLSDIYPFFDRITEKIASLSVFQISHLNVIYSDFQKIRIQETNYCVKVGEIVRNCTPYKMKTNLENIKEELIMFDYDHLSEALKKSEIDGQESEFIEFVQVDNERTELKCLLIDKTLDKIPCFLNESDFNNGYYVPEEFEAV